jgi:hypothetical protein
VAKLHVGCLLPVCKEVGGGVSDICGKISNVTKFSVLEDVGTSERCGKQCGHERAWLLLIYRKMSENCGINCGKVACRMSTVCLQGVGGRGGVSNVVQNSKVAKFSVLDDVGISERAT